MDFLNEYYSIPWSCDNYSNINCEKVVIGNGNNALEVLITSSENRPTKNELIKVWNLRKGRRANPLLLINIYEDSVIICGISGDDPSVIRDLDIHQMERISEVALNKTNRHSAYRFLKDRINKLDSELMGIVNQGLLSTHELKKGVPNREDWEEAVNKSTELLDYEGKELILSLGYEIEELDRNSYILKDETKDTAVAVFLDEGVSFEQPQETFNSKSPVNWALKRADEKRLPFVIANSGKALRLYSTNPEDGFGSRGRTDTYVEANLDLLTNENCGYLWLLYSTDALKDNGKLYEILNASKDYAIGLGERLKERIYDEVIPELAEGIASARNLIEPDKQELDQTYRMALLVLFRLLFIAYGEDEKFLPYNQNSRYTNHSLKKKVHSLEELIKEDIDLDPHSTSHWNEFNRLVEEIHSGNAEWGLPKYNGRLLSSDPDISSEGSIIADLELTNDCFGNILINLLIDETEEGYKGAIDFRNLGVREFGVIYEGLLESELSIADRNLKLNKDNEYVPATEEEDVYIYEGDIYLHGISGERKATGSYYTKSIFVEYLLENSLEPALKEHLDYLDSLTKREAEEEFFNFKIADIAMGSGHFLISAVDMIEKEFSKYLTKRNLPKIEQELDRLREASKNAFNNDNLAPEVDDSQLLRRQIARRCIFGVDLNKTAVDLARLSVWVHTFIPGLPLTFLNHNLVMGDSLAGIGTLKEAADLLEEEEKNLFSNVTDNKKRVEEIQKKVKQLGKLADADAKEVSKARELQEALKIKTDNYKKLFDILSASRLVGNIDPTSIFNKIYDIRQIETLSEYKIAKEKLKDINPLHFPLKFPEVFQNDNKKVGFDLIVGNPPWEEQTLEEDEFWMRYYPGLQGKAEKEKMKIIENLKKERPDLLEKYNRELKKKEIKREILVNGPYPGMGKGDPDTYKAFCWRFLRLVNYQGYMSVVLPRSVFVSAGSKKFRKEILNHSIIKDLVFLKNKNQWVFDITPQYTISLLSLKKKKPTSDDYLPLKGPYPDEESFQKGKSKRPYLFTIENAKQWTKTSAFPMLPAVPESVDIFKKMSQFPPLDYNNSEEWRARPNTELHGTNDKKDKDGTTIMHFSKEPPEENYMPIYKGKSFNIWNPDTGVRYAWANPDVVIDYLQKKRENSYKLGKRSAYYEMEAEWINDKNSLPCFDYRLVFRDIARSTDKRTIITSIIPPRYLLSNTAPYFLWIRGNNFDKAYLLGVMSSLIFDWYARRFIELHVNFHLINAFPVPRPKNKNIIRDRIIKLSARLIAIDDRYKSWAEELSVEYGPLNQDKKQNYINELDALVALLYDLNVQNIKIIFNTHNRNQSLKNRMNNVIKYYKKWEDKI